MQLVRRFVPAKKVSADLETKVKEGALSAFGEVKSQDEGRVEWEIPRERVSSTVAAILKELPVKDLTVEEMPLEDVVRKIFVQGKVK
jgi:ABC-2 type transport system ATP-binding protein